MSQWNLLWNRRFAKTKVNARGARHQVILLPRSRVISKAVYLRYQLCKAGRERRGVTVRIWIVTLKKTNKQKTRASFVGRVFLVCWPTRDRLCACSCRCPCVFFLLFPLSLSSCLNVRVTFQPFWPF